MIIKNRDPSKTSVIQQTIRTLTKPSKHRGSFSKNVFVKLKTRPKEYTASPPLWRVSIIIVFGRPTIGQRTLFRTYGKQKLGFERFWRDEFITTERKVHTPTVTARRSLENRAHAPFNRSLSSAVRDVFTFCRKKQIKFKPNKIYNREKTAEFAVRHSEQVRGFWPRPRGKSRESTCMYINVAFLIVVYQLLWV